MRRGAVAVAAAVLGACGADDSTDDLGLSDASGSVPVVASTIVPADPAAMCTELFRAWSTGELSSTSRFVTAGATAELASRPFTAAEFGLAGSGSDCFITQYDPTGATLVAVGDVIVAADADGALLISTITWSDAASLPSTLTDRLMRSAPLVYPGGVVATTVPGTPTPSGPGDSTAGVPGPESTPAPGGTVAPGTPTGPGDTLAPGTTRAPGSSAPGASSPATPAPTTSPGATNPTVAWTTAPPTTAPPAMTTLAPTIGQASDTALAEDCANAYQPACAELERRYAPTGGDASVANEFVNAVIAGDTDSAAAVATPGLIGYVSALSRGPYPAIDGIDVPGTSFGPDGRLQFRVTATTIVRCYVATGLVRHCSSAAG